MLGAVVEDGLRLRRADARQRDEVVLGGGVEIDGGEGDAPRSRLQEVVSDEKPGAPVVDPHEVVVAAPKGVEEDLWMPVFM